MRLMRYGSSGRERPALADADGNVHDVSAIVPDFAAAGLAASIAALRGVSPESLPRVADGVRIGPPLSGIGKIVCVGLNYVDHARETGQAPPREPILFLKATSAIVGPNDDIVLPPDAQKGDWEVELGVVIGKEARYVPLDRALEHVAGYCIVNDVSERSYQIERGGQWDKGKGCDTFCPIGPFLATADEVADFRALHLQCRVNGRTVQSGNTRDMIFDVPFLVHYVSQFMSLQPGDVISTGTPHGVGMAMKPPQWLREGDVVELAIDGLGAQRQCVKRYRL
ncbi:MAG: fumarylacetoacetate hydrolase family protein [Rudaea sp.]|uniref:fumarylacetoacetate hydrolase family protein n=1 Tax=Rudaea sp. TaxID=2136325 RepID=UPI0039E4E661